MISATTVPDGVALLWTSNNSDAATVDQEGNVTGLAWWTEAKITASFVYEGVTYKDSVMVYTRDYDFEIPITQHEAWEDPTRWEKQNYTDETRKTYIAYEPNDGMFSDGALKNTYNESGSATSLYADIAMYKGDFQPSPDKDYYLEVYYSTVNGEQLQINFINRLFAKDGWSNIVLPESDTDVTYYPLAVSDVMNDRLFTIQTKDESRSGVDSPVIGLAIVSKPKA